MPTAESSALLGGLTAAAFLRRHWQKRALLVRGAVPGFSGCVTRQALFDLAGRDDVDSRIVLRERNRWTTFEGPLRKSLRRSLPARGWTLLVHGVNLHVPAADALLRRFAFIPYARLDDLMVSYAAPGGGVGPHFDSYDVFLLQGQGRRRWRISRQRDLALKPRMPLKILARFRPTTAWTLASGDMLYLPPDHAHDGVAVDACTTYSIGFRAPVAQELGTAFLDWLRDGLALEGRYADPHLHPTREPARIDATMRRACAAMLRAIRWDDVAVASFVGSYLSEPKPQVTFTPPDPALPLRAFARAAGRRGVSLNPCAQILYDERNVYVNGAVLAWPDGAAERIMSLANARRLRGADCNGAALAPVLHDWYRDGYLTLD
jgi:50S ribosomal protein L16 3-hydroxylase